MSQLSEPCRRWPETALWNVDGRGPIGQFASIDSAIAAVEAICEKDLRLEWHPILRVWELRDPTRKKYATIATLHNEEALCLAALKEGLKEARNNTVNGLGEWVPIGSEPHYHKWEAGNVCY